MLETLNYVIAENGGPSQRTLEAGAKNVTDFLQPQTLDVASEIDLAAIMIGTATELAGVGSIASQLIHAPCKELTIKSPAPIMGGCDSRIIHGDDLPYFDSVFPFLDHYSLALMLENHFNCIASMQNLLANYPKMNGLSITTNSKSIAAVVHFDLLAPAYVVPLSITCEFEIESENPVSFDTQEYLDFEPWNLCRD